MSDDKKSKVLTAALSVFLRYGFRRANMNDIAQTAGVSRPALYLLFKNKEDIFISVFSQWVEETVALIAAEMATAATPKTKIERAFEIWAVLPFEMMMNSPEAKELVDCSFEFAQDCLRQGYDKFEAVIIPVLAAAAENLKAGAQMAPESTAHVLASAVRGFKQAAATPDELRQLIKELLLLIFSAEVSGKRV